MTGHPVQDQGPTLDFIRREVRRMTGDEPRVFETHISVVVVAGGIALKLKRATRQTYLDFSTAERRLAACRRELELNRRTAPGLYRTVRRVTARSGGGLAFDGDGALVDAVLEMAAFDQGMLFDRLAHTGRLTSVHAAELATAVADFHAAEPPVTAGPTGSARMAAVHEINERELAAGIERFDRAAVEALIAMTRDAWRNHVDRLDARARQGLVRHCHGDLHLRNICLVEDRPTLFDCLEFNDDLATTDVLYDLAFLLMDLRHLGRGELANLVMNRYLDRTGDEDGIGLLPYFMAVRATVRAQVEARAAGAVTAGQGAAHEQAARTYLALATALLEPCVPRVVAVGGPSGSGKSTLAAALAPALGGGAGARILSSDRIRKALFGVGPMERLGPAAYEPVVSDKVYAQIGSRAMAILRLGQPVVADAVFGAERGAALERVAAAEGVAFTGFWLDAPLPDLLARVEARTNDPSDATGDVVLAQSKSLRPPPRWTRLRATPGGATPREAALAALGVEDQSGR